MPTRERGRPARTTLARPHPTPRPGSTGNGPRTLLRPSPCRTRRQGGRVPHRGKTERQATGMHAGGTPALPRGAFSQHCCSSKGRAPACQAAAPAGAAQPSRLVALRGPWRHFLDHSFFGCFRYVRLTAFGGVCFPGRRRSGEPTRARVRANLPRSSRLRRRLPVESGFSAPRPRRSGSSG